MLVTGFDDRFFYEQVMDVVKALLVGVPESKFEITYVPHPENSCDQDPDKFDILVDDASDFHPAPQLMYKWSFNRKTDDYREFLHRIVDDLTEVWYI